MADIAHVERMAVRALPAPESTTVDGWYVPFGRGAVGRLNSVVTFGTVPEEPLEAIERVERRYRGRTETVRFRLNRLDATIDDLLFARGYDRRVETMVMTRGLPGGADDPMEPTRAVTRRWLDLLTRFTGDSDERIAEIGEALSTLDIPHAAFDLDGAAIGLVVVDGDWAGLFDIAVDPTLRRQGLGRRVSRAMMQWAAERGAQNAYLQVVAENTAATSLYRSLGFEELYRYWYRIKQI